MAQISYKHSDYVHILSTEKCACLLVELTFSLPPTAQMGVGEGKSVGEWYGPNTVAQVLR